MINYCSRSATRVFKSSTNSLLCQVFYSILFYSILQYIFMHVALSKVLVQLQVYILLTGQFMVIMWQCSDEC